MHMRIEADYRPFEMVSRGGGGRDIGRDLDVVRVHFSLFLSLSVEIPLNEK